MDLDSFYPAKERFKLAMRLNNLLAAPGFEAWLEGDPLNINRMLFTEGGKPKASIFTISHLSDAERMFFVSMLLNEILAWMRTQDGTSSLRAILYMDEIFGYFPPVKNPPSKAPLLTLFPLKTRWTWITKVCPIRDRGLSAACKPTVTRNACWPGWKGLRPAQDLTAAACKKSWPGWASAFFF
jgi:hypothetical protein